MTGGEPLPALAGTVAGTLRRLVEGARSLDLGSAEKRDASRVFEPSAPKPLFNSQGSIEAPEVQHGKG